MARHREREPPDLQEGRGALFRWWGVCPPWGSDRPGPPSRGLSRYERANLPERSKCATPCQHPRDVLPRFARGSMVGNSPSPSPPLSEQRPPTAPSALRPLIMKSSALTTRDLVDAMTVDEFAALAHCSTWSVRRYIREGTLDAVRSGRSWLIPRRAADEWIFRRRNKPAK